jgi:hypothetical protein
MSIALLIIGVAWISFGFLSIYRSRHLSGNSALLRQANFNFWIGVFYVSVGSVVIALHLLGIISFPSLGVSLLIFIMCLIGYNTGVDIFLSLRKKKS